MLTRLSAMLRPTWRRSVQPIDPAEQAVLDLLRQRRLERGVEPAQSASAPRVRS